MTHNLKKFGRFSLLAFSFLPLFLLGAFSLSGVSLTHAQADPAIEVGVPPATPAQEPAPGSVLNADQNAFSNFNEGAQYGAQGFTQTVTPQQTTRSAAAGSQQLYNPLKFTNIGDVIVSILQLVVYLGFFVAIFFVIYSGFLFVTAQGSEEKLEKAKENFFYTIIGVAILLGAQAIALIVKATVQQLAPGSI